MIRTSAHRGFSLGLGGRRAVIVLWASLLSVLVALAAGVGAVVAALTLAPPGAAASVADGATDLPLASTIQVRPLGWDPRLESATLEETLFDRDGRRSAPREVPLQVEVLRAGWQPDQTEVAIRPAGGSLRPDGTYRLLLRGTALEAAWPWPQPAPFEREIRFSTPASPRALPATGAVQLKWEEPLPIRWSAPIEDFRFDVSPSASARSWVNPQDRRESWVVIEEPDDGATYQITVTAARAVSGIDLQHPETYTVVAPVRPRLLDGEEPLKIEIGKPVQLRWNVPIDRMTWEIDPPATLHWEADRRDPKLIELRLDGLAQGTTYDLTIGEAYAASTGAPLVESRTIQMTTPPKLMLEDLDTGTTAARASVRARPVIIFAQPIRDRRVAQEAITIEPALAGRFEWIDDSQVRWVPAKNLPYNTSITVRIKPGPDGPRSVAGSYFERPAVLSFTTEQDKIIDVDVTRQVMTLIQEGRAVQTLPVATGVPGADTPIGQFYVEYKMPVARFRGVNVNGSRYDIPDVKWVLSFQGDYTIHGAYWRSGFGAPGSNGCISLTDANAKLVYDWAPEGTLVRIHH